MTLGFEQNGQYFRVKVKKLGQKKSKDSTIGGFRRIDQILLFDNTFDEFIEALMIDDFEAVRNIFASVLDTVTKELPYHSGVKDIKVIGDGETDPFLKNLLG